MMGVPAAARLSSLPTCILDPKKFTTVTNTFCTCIPIKHCMLLLADDDDNDGGCNTHKATYLFPFFFFFSVLSHHVACSIHYLLATFYIPTPRTNNGSAQKVTHVRNFFRVICYSEREFTQSFTCI